MHCKTTTMDNKPPCKSQVDIYFYYVLRETSLFWPEELPTELIHVSPSAAPMCHQDLSSDWPAQCNVGEVAEAPRLESVHAAAYFRKVAQHWPGRPVAHKVGLASPRIFSERDFLKNDFSQRDFLKNEIHAHRNWGCGLPLSPLPMDPKKIERSNKACFQLLPGGRLCFSGLWPSHPTAIAIRAHPGPYPYSPLGTI